jgi:NAD(P)-dependent dehydrogenase (short-subunit alcohol dehydrogenase family)
MESFSLKGKVALLTGGAGLYGRQLCRALCEAGATVYIASRNLEKLQAEAEKSGAAALQLDLDSDESIASVVDEIVKRSGRIDILVNNAVSRCACGEWAENMDCFDRSLHTNASSLFVLTKRVAEIMKKQRSGSIINIGSYMGLLGPDPTNYTGTEMFDFEKASPIYFYEKGGMSNFTRFAASVLGHWNIRVNCIAPGGYFNHQPEAFVRQYSANTMLGRLANDEDLKGLLVFLASDASAYITGTVIPADGGYTAK